MLTLQGWLFSVPLHRARADRNPVCQVPPWHRPVPTDGCFFQLSIQKTSVGRTVHPPAISPTVSKSHLYEGGVGTQQGNARAAHVGGALVNTGLMLESRRSI